AGAALGCYLVSLRVASERAALEDVETSIVLAERDIRLLQTEIGTRGRLAQLERWNVKVLALSAPSADQFLEGGFALAKLARPQEMIDPAAPVVLASAPAAEETDVLAEAEQDGDSTPRTGPASLVHQASFRRVVRLDTPKAELGRTKLKGVTEAPKPAGTKAITVAKPAKQVVKPAPKAVQQSTPKAFATPVSKGSSTAAATKPAAKLVDKKSTEKKDSALAKPVTKPARLAKADPLAPLTVGGKTKAAKDLGSTR
ncbi:MAG: hypothetical protein M3Q52_06100, partial [Pseudomonadota bacterium]|nr:hypothetical protein [Pseudomonadota bacterium]